MGHLSTRNERDTVTAEHRNRESRKSASRLGRISVVGLGKLGLCLAAVLADSGFEVVGVDIDRAKVDAVNRGSCPIYEPTLPELIRSNRKRLSATTDYGVAIGKTQVTFVVVPTPSDKTGGFSLQFVRRAMRLIGKALAPKHEYHLVVLTSTVMPGSMDETVLPVLESSSGKKCGRDFGLCYNPEFIALGNVVAGLRRPDFVLVGESDSRAGDKLTEVHRRVCANHASIERMNFLNAEVAKIAVNSFVTMKMSFANTLAEVSERLPNGDVDKITHAIGRDSRIGPAYLKGAIGYGGPCFPRDNRAFATFAKKVGVRANLALATDEINERQVLRIRKLIEDGYDASSTRIGILGLTYKPDTNVTEASQGLALASALTEKGFEVHVYDPAIRGDHLRELQGLKVETSADACLAKCDVCVIATPWPSFARISGARFSSKTVFDCWRILNGNKPRDRSSYIALGQSMAAQKDLAKLTRIVAGRAQPAQACVSSGPDVLS